VENFRRQQKDVDEEAEKETTMQGRSDEE